MLAKLYKRYQRVIKFGLVGISGIPVNYVFMFIGKAFLFKGLNENIADSLAYLLGIVISIFTNFVLNYLWTWSDRRKAGLHGFFEQLGKFYVVSAVAASIQFGVSIGLSLWLKQYTFMQTVIISNYRYYNALAPAVGILAGFIVNYWVNNVWTFKKQNTTS